MGDDHVRIRPVEHWPDDSRSALERLAGADGRVPHVFTTLANHPPLFRRWLGLGDHLLNRSTLSARTREMIILRTSVRAGSAYEWAHHAVIGRAAGLTGAELSRLADAAPDADGWSAADRAVLSAVDELHATGTLSDAAWAALDGWTTQQRMDLVMTAGFYTMTAMALNSFGVAIEPGFDDGPEGTAR